MRKPPRANGMALLIPDKAGIQHDHISYSLVSGRRWRPFHLSAHFSSLISPASVDWPSLTMIPSFATLR